MGHAGQVRWAVCDNRAATEPPAAHIPATSEPAAGHTPLPRTVPLGAKYGLPLRVPGLLDLGPEGLKIGEVGGDDGLCGGGWKVKRRGWDGRMVGWTQGRQEVGEMEVGLDTAGSAAGC